MAVAVVVMARKKHSAKGGVRVTKDYGTPPDAIRRGEIVEEIVDHLRPWKDRVSETTATADVNSEMDMLIRFVPWKDRWSNHARNRAHAQKLDRALLEVEELTRLASTPGGLAVLLFSTPSRMSIVDIEKANQAFAAKLRRMRMVCAVAMGPSFGTPPNYNTAQHLSAESAYDLMKKLSQTKPVGTEDKAFRAIASLLYESDSGIRNAGMKRACESVLSRYRDQVRTDPPD